MHYLPNLFFVLLLAFGIIFFIKNAKKIYRNIQLGKPINRSDQTSERWKTMLLVAFGQSKMTRRPVAGILHLFVYAGFIIINLEMLEIVIDGLFGTHRVFSILGGFYDFLIGSFEILAFLVLVSVIVFWIRRMVLKIPRFWTTEMTEWPRRDALTILYFEMVLMSLFLLMNAADFKLQTMGAAHYPPVGSFPISTWIASFLPENLTFLILMERSAWWLHIFGVMVFLNYLYYSKHLHILLAFPNTYFSKVEPKGQLNNVESITKEVKLMLDPNANPYATPADDVVPEKFGASDVFDLHKIQLLNAYTCTECGRCTASCPANQTGKILSPRAIMMKTRDRLEEVSRNIDKNGTFVDDNKTLLNDYITPEELWACTSCNACVEECPVLIDPLSIIIDMRRYLVMEQSAAPTELNAMMTNIENNGAPWQYSQMDRANWVNE